MRRDWPIKTIAECASPEPYSTQIGPFGKALMADEYSESGVPVLRGVNVNQGRFHDGDFVFIDAATADRLSKFESYPGDVLLVHKGTLGQIGLMPNQRRYSRYIMGNSMMRVRCDTTKLLPEYLYYWLSSPEGQHYIFSRVSQVGVPQIQTPLTTLRQAALPVPSLAEQTAITTILGKLDDKIELNRRMNETLEATARAIFKSWFVAFDSVGVNVDEMRVPDGPAEQPFDLSLNSFPSGLPKAWQRKPVSTICQINSRQLRDAEPDYALEYIDISSAKRGQILETQLFRFADAPSRARRLVQEGDTVVSTVRPGNRAYFFVAKPPDNLVVSTGYAVLTPAANARALTYLSITSDETIDQLDQLADGGAYPAVRPDQIGAVEIVWPGERLASVFERLVRPFLLRIAANDRESQTLAATRDILLPKLISGEIRTQKPVEAQA
jgi:type I restriction enzyme, S subunit